MARLPASIEVVDLTSDDEKKSVSHPGFQNKNPLVSNIGYSPRKNASYSPVKLDGLNAAAISKTNREVPGSGGNSECRQLPRASADGLHDNSLPNGSGLVAKDCSTPNPQTLATSDAPASGNLVGNSGVIDPQRPPSRISSSLENGKNLQSILKELHKGASARGAVNIASKDTKPLATLQNSTQRVTNAAHGQGNSIKASSYPFLDLAVNGQSGLDVGGANSSSAFYKAGPPRQGAKPISAPLTPFRPATLNSFTRWTEPLSGTSQKRKRSSPRPASEAPMFVVPPDTAWSGRRTPALARPSVPQVPSEMSSPFGPVQPPNSTIQLPPKPIVPNINSNKSSTPAVVLSPEPAPSNQHQTSRSSSPIKSRHNLPSGPRPSSQETLVPRVGTSAEQATPQGALSVDSETLTMDSWPPEFDRGRFPYQRRRRGPRNAPNPYIAKGHHQGTHSDFRASKPGADALMPPPLAPIAPMYNTKETGPRFGHFSQARSEMRPIGYTPSNVQPLGENQAVNGVIGTGKGSQPEFEASNANQSHQTGNVQSSPVRHSNYMNWLQRKETQTFLKDSSLEKNDANVQNTTLSFQEDQNGVHSNDVDLVRWPQETVTMNDRDDNFNRPSSSLNTWPIPGTHASPPVNNLASPFIQYQASNDPFLDRRPTRSAASAAASRITSQYELTSRLNLQHRTKPIEQKNETHVPTVQLPRRLCYDCDLLISASNFNVHLATKKHKQNASIMEDGQEDEEVQTTQHKARQSRLQTPAFASDVKPAQSIFPAQDEIISPVILQARRKAVQGNYNISLAASFAAGDSEILLPYQKKKARSRIEVVDRLNLLKQSRILQHVDFTAEETAAISRAIVKTEDGRVEMSKTVANAYADPTSVIAGRDERTTRIHIQNIDGYVDRQAPALFTVIESHVKDPIFRSARCIGSLLRHRELGSSSTGRHVEARSEMKSRAAQNIKPWRSFIGASHDVVSVAWTPDSMQFGAGAVAHSNPEDLQYNRPCNLLFGDIYSNTIRELPDHRTDRQMPRTGPNAQNEDLFNACDPKVYKTVTSVKFNPRGDQMYTASEDATAKIWDLSSAAPRIVRSLGHDANVTSLEISDFQTGVFATASQTIQNAIRIYRITESQETLITLSSGRAESKPEWKMYPECLHWGSTSHTGHLLLGGFQQYEREANRESEGHLCLWDVNTAQDLRLMPAAQAIHTVVWHPFLPYVASGGAPGFERTDRLNTKTVVRTWDLRHTKRVNMEYECQAHEMTDVTFSPIDHNIITAGCTNSKSYVWDFRWPQQPLHELCHGDSVMPRGERDTGVMMSLWGTGSSLYYTGSSDGSIRAWDIRRHPNDVLRHTVAQLDAGIQSGALSPDGTHLLVGDATGGIHVLSSAPWTPHPEESAEGEIETTSTPIEIIRAPDGSGAMKVDDDNPGTEGIEAAKDLVLTGQIIIDPVYGPGKGPNYPTYPGPYAMDVREEREGNFIGRLKQEVYKQQPFSRLGDIRPEYADPIRILATARKELLGTEIKTESGVASNRSKPSNLTTVPLNSVREQENLTPIIDYEGVIPESVMLEDPGWWPRLGEEEIYKAFARPGVRMG